MTLPWNKNKSGDMAGCYYTAQGDTPQKRYTNFKAIKPPLTNWEYKCPADVNHGPFVGDGCPAELGPIASNRPWMPFAARNEGPGVLPLPLTISASKLGFVFSTPPVFTYGGPKYWPSRPEKDQAAVQYYGNAKSDFWIAPAIKTAQGFVPAEFPAPSDKAAPYTVLDGFSDWAATGRLTNASKQSLAVTFATGSPLAFVTFDKQTDYACLGLSRLTYSPTRSWYPKGYRCELPAGVSIQVSGHSPVDAHKSWDLVLEIRLAQQTVRASCPVRDGDTKEGLAKRLRQAFASTPWAYLFDISDVTSTQPPGPKGDFEFFVNPKDRSVVLDPQKNVTVSPTGGEQVVLVPRLESVRPVPFPPNESIIGITVADEYEWSHEPNAPKRVYYASYALIAPTGAQWSFSEIGRLICDFTKATAESKTVIVCAMPTLGDDAYRQYDSLAGGAAVQLQGYWELMRPFAYGCPRHLTNGKDDGTGTRLGPNEGNRFTPRVKTEQGKTTVTTEFLYNLTYPAGRPAGTGGTLFCLFPHQWRPYANCTANIVDAGAWEPIYWTVSGPLKLAAGGATPNTPAFTTTHVFPGVVAHLPNVANLPKIVNNKEEEFTVYDYPNTKPQQTTRETLTSQMARDAATPVWGADDSKSGTPRAFIPVPPNSQRKYSADSYGWGKLVGLLGDLIPCAQDLKHTKAVTSAIGQLNAQLAQWLSGTLVDSAGTASALANQQFLFYDQQWKTLIPYPTAYDAETQINDHHFHYGYWVRAAAQLALAQARKLDPQNAAGTFIKNYGATVNLLIKDIANPLRNDMQSIGANGSIFPNGPAMPFLRYFDGYSGHSWASGLEVNVINQESVSEAISAWTGVILWGEVTKDTKMRDLGIWMYTHEMLSFYEYWMDCAEGVSAVDKSTYFPSGSPATAKEDGYWQAIRGGADGGATTRFFSQVFNGYRQLSTFFGWEPIWEIGIQWLPFHGGSFYLSSSDAVIQRKLGKTWKWCYQNSKFLWDNYNNKKPLVSLKPDQGIDVFVNELNASVNDKDKTKQVTEGLRDQFKRIGYHVAPKGDVWRVIVTKISDTEWTVADSGEKTYTAKRTAASLDIFAHVGSYRPTLFALTWEPIAWQGLALMDPVQDQVYEDSLLPEGKKLWKDVVWKDFIWNKLEEAVGSLGDKDIYGKGWNPLDGQAVSYSYYWIANACTLGVRDATASADYPFAIKFLGKEEFGKRGPAKYVVWNLTDAAKTVTFSDGFKVTGVPAYTYVVKP